MTIEYGQPRLVPPPTFPVFPELPERPVSKSQEWATRSRSYASRASSRGSFSVRRHLNAYNGFHSGRPPRKMSIGAPQDFRHVENALPRRAPTFRPLELSIYLPGDTQLSPILPFLFKPEDPSCPLDDADGSEYSPTHSRSGSSLSFRIPRKPLRTSSRASSEWSAQFKPRPESLSTQELLAALESELPKVPLPARLRALTAPPAYERVKSALHEKHELEQRLKDIDEAIEERQSLYFSSRPVSRATTADRPASITSVYEESQGMSYIPQLTYISDKIQNPCQLCSPHLLNERFSLLRINVQRPRLQKPYTYLRATSPLTKHRLRSINPKPFPQPGRNFYHLHLSLWFFPSHRFERRSPSPVSQIGYSPTPIPATSPSIPLRTTPNLLRQERDSTNASNSKTT